MLVLDYELYLLSSNLMIVVIIAGGSGTRLWPLSTPDYPKHLLKLTDSRSLLQNTLRRIKPLAKAEQIFVISEISHAQHVFEQLKELPKENILIEPSRRGTASCIVLALSEVAKRGLPDEPILFLWADHLVRDNKEFVATMRRAGKVALSEQKLAFIGVEPSYASTGFGYMRRSHPLAEHEGVYELGSFEEKPDQATAEKYLKSGQYYWNTGYLVGTRSVFEREMQAANKQLWENLQTLITSSDTEKIYNSFTSEPIDTALSEKIIDGLIVPGTFDWIDIGSFKDLHSISEQDESGNHIKGEHIILEGASNCYVRNENELPVAVIGLENVVVVSTPSGVLVTSADHAQKVGEVSKRINGK